MKQSFKLTYGDRVLTTPDRERPLACSGDYPSGTYTRTLFFNPSATSAGNLNDSIYNYDLLRITTIPGDPVNNKLVAMNPPTYVEPEWLRENTVHVQPFGYANDSTINVSGYFIWADNEFSATNNGTSFVNGKHGAYFRTGDCRWNTTQIPQNGDSGIYWNYLHSIYQIDGIYYNENRDLLYSGSVGTSAVTLSKAISAENYSVIQVKLGIQGYDGRDGYYINELSPTRSATRRDTLAFPFGGTGNWYLAQVPISWSTDQKSFTCSAAKAFMKSLTAATAMTGNTNYNAKLRNCVLAVWGVK